MHPERVPSLSPPVRRVKRKGIEQEEEKAWIRFYRRVGNADTAAEVMALLDTDADARRDHLALYLMCRESLRAHKQRGSRNKRISHAVRSTAHALLAAPWQSLTRRLSHGAALVVECLPAATREPAQAKVRQLKADPATATALAAFTSPEAATPGTSQPQERARTA